MQYPSLPLLHIVQSAARVEAVDPAFVALAVLTLLAAAFYIWTPRTLSLGCLTRSPLMRVTLSTLIFFAVLPSVAPYDHLVPGLMHADISLGEEAAHSTHCHVSPGSCADAPIPAGPNQLIYNAPLIITPALLSILLAFTLPVLTGISIKPDTRPPLG